MGLSSIDGIISNLDTTSIIDAIVEAESGMLNYLRVRQAEKTNMATTYQSLSAVMVALQSSASLLSRRSAFELSLISSSDESVLTAESTSEVTPGTFTLNVVALARNHQIASQGFEDADSTSLGAGTVRISIGDGSITTLTIDENNDSLTGLKNAINDANLGVTASIVDDGTWKNPFRLILTADETGKDNAVNITLNLSGGTTPNFATAVFDDVETDRMSAESTSAVSKGATAAYSGSENKTYTFTVAGIGTPTVGSADVTINWTDGTNEGSIVVSEADTEVALTGGGSDGLKLSFGAGDLKAGDTFTVQGFAPTLQVAADAQVSLGSTAGGGSPITISSATNEIEDLVPGIKLTLKDVSTAPVTISVSIDKLGIKDAIAGMLNKYNTVMDKINEQFAYNEETGQAGLLLGDGYLMAIQSRIQSALSGALAALPPSMNMLAAVGISPGENSSYRLTSSSALHDAIDEDFDAVKNLFINSGNSTNPLVQFLSATDSTQITAEGYEVNITQVATQGYVQAGGIYDPASQSLVIDSTNSNLVIVVDGVTSETITLTEKTYVSASDLINELQSKIGADDKIGKYGVAVEWISTGSATGYIQLTSPSYGEMSQVTFDLGVANSAKEVLGLTNKYAVTGQNVAGTINGETATGVGRVLTGDEGNANTEGLKLMVSLTSADLIDGAEAVVTYAEGFAARLERTLESITRSVDGVIARRTKGLDGQIEYYDGLIADFEERLEERRQALYMQFYEMERLLGEMQSQSTYLSSQIAQITSLWQ